MSLLAALLSTFLAASEAKAPPRWPGFYELAGEHWRAGRKEEALRWFYVGQLRGRINVNCTPQEASGGPALIGALQEVLGSPLNGWAGGVPDIWIRVIDEVLVWDAANADPDVVTDACRAEQAKQRQGLRDLRTYIDTNRAELASGRKKNGLDR